MICFIKIVNFINFNVSNLKKYIKFTTMINGIFENQSVNRYVAAQLILIFQFLLKILEFEFYLYKKNSTAYIT